MLEVKVNVQIGVTPEVASLVSAILNKPAGVEAPKPAAPAAETEAPAEAAAAPAARRGRPKKEQAAQAEQAAEAAAPAADPKPEDTGDMPDSVYFPQEEDVRTAMHKTRERIEGEDYKDKPSDDLHRAVTDVFKAIANDLSGQKKPSALPQELRQAFIDATRTIAKGEDGKFYYEIKK